MKIFKAIYFIVGLIAFYVAMGMGFYKYGIAAGILFVLGAYALVFLDRRR